MSYSDYPNGGPSIFCPNCGTPLPSHAKFCNKCGNKIQPVSNVNAEIQTQDTHYPIPVNVTIEALSDDRQETDSIPNDGDRRFQGNNRSQGNDRFQPDDRFQGDDRFQPDNRFQGDDRFQPDNRFQGDDRFQPDNRFRPDDRFQPDDRFPNDGRNPDDYRRPNDGRNPDDYRRPNDGRNPDDYRRPNDGRNPDDYRRPNDGRNPDDHRQPNDRRNPDDYRRPNDGRNPDDYRRPNDGRNPDDYRQPNDGRNPDDYRRQNDRRVSGGYPPQGDPRYIKPDHPSSPNSSKLIAQISFGILAVITLLFGIKALVGALENLYYYIEYIFYGNFFFKLINFFRNMLLLLAAVGMLGNAFLQLLAMVKIDRSNSKGLWGGIVGCSSIVIVSNVLWLIFSILISYGSYAFKSVGLPILGSILTVALTFGILQLTHMPALEQMNLEHVKYAFSRIMPDISNTLSSFKKDSAGFNSHSANPSSRVPNTPEKKAGFEPTPIPPQIQPNPQPNPQPTYTPPVNQTVNQLPPNRGTRKLNEHRGLLLLIIFSGLTCGIYYFYFISKLAQDVNVACAGDGNDDTSGLGGLIGYSILTCGVYNLCWEYGLINRVKQNASRYNVSIELSGLSFLLWTYTGILLCGLGPIIAQYKLLKSVNTLCRAYNQANGL